MCCKTIFVDLLKTIRAAPTTVKWLLESVCVCVSEWVSVYGWVFKYVYVCGAHGPCGALSGNKQPTTSTWTSARGSWPMAHGSALLGSWQPAAGSRQHRRRLPCFLFCVIYEIISHTHSHTYAHMDTQLRIMMLACLGQAGGQTAGLGGLS